MFEFYIIMAVTSGLILLVAALTTRLGEKVGLFIEKTVFKPGRFYWASRMDAFGDAALFAALGSIVTEMLKISPDGVGVTLAMLLFIGAIIVFLTANWFRN